MSSGRANNFCRRGADHDDDEDANGEASAAKPLPGPPSTRQIPAEAYEALRLQSAELRRRRRSSRNPRSLKTLLFTTGILLSQDHLAERPLGSAADATVQRTPPGRNVYQKKKEALLELRKNTQNVDSSSKPDPESRPVILLKVLVRPQTAVKEKSETSQKERESEIDYNSDEKILDQAMIVGEAPLIIPLESGKSTGHGAAAFGELSDEEAEFRGRIPMLGERSDGMKKGVFRSFHERATEVVSRTENMLEEEEEEGEEAKKEWEEEQVRKGLLKRIDDSNSQGANSSSGNIGSVPVMPQKFTYSLTTVNAFTSSSMHRRGNESSFTRTGWVVDFTAG